MGAHWLAAVPTPWQGEGQVSRCAADGSCQRVGMVAECGSWAGDRACVRPGSPAQPGWGLSWREAGRRSEDDQEVHGSEDWTPRPVCLTWGPGWLPLVAGQEFPGTLFLAEGGWGGPRAAPSLGRREYHGCWLLVRFVSTDNAARVTEAVSFKFHFNWLPLI